MTRHNFLSRLDHLELAFWIAFLVVVALVVGLWKSLFLSRSRVSATHGRDRGLHLVEDDPDGIDPLGDLMAILT